jgi:glycosyltransferase involved in cell wall biosynthesis
MKLSVIIPVYNEEKTLNEIVEKVQRVKIQGIEKEIIIVNDFSTDRTQEVIDSISKRYKNIYSFSHKKNGGKGAAIRTALGHISGDIIVIQDGDLEYDPEDFNLLIKPILEGKTKVVYGSRFLNKTYQNLGSSGTKRVPMSTHYLGNKFLSFVTRLLYNQNITDMETCYKMFTKEVISHIKIDSNRFDFEPEITSKIIRSNHKIVEVPIKYYSRSFEEGKKITWKDGISAIYKLFKYRFV